MDSHIGDHKIDEKKAIKMTNNVLNRLKCAGNICDLIYP